MKLKQLSILLLCACASSMHAQQIITTIAGTGTSGFSGDGAQATAAQFALPEGVAVDNKGSTFIADKTNQRIRKIDAAGIISTIAGNGTSGYSGDGLQGTAAQLNFPTSVATDTAGNVYFADSQNNVIRKVSTSGVITTVVGNGVAGFSGDNGYGTACELNAPLAVYVNAAGTNFFIADNGNNRVRKEDGSGRINTIGGNGIAGFSGDGALATAAELNGIMGITVDSKSNVYVSDYNNNRIRMITQPGRIITTIAGNGTAGYSGDGAQATACELNGPFQLTTDAARSLYIADKMNKRIRKIDSNAVITTVVGNGTLGFSGDGGQATACELNFPTAVAVNATANIFVADESNLRIRETMMPLGVNVVQAESAEIKVYPNPSSGVFTIMQPVPGEGMLRAEVYNVLGEKIANSQWPIANGPKQIDLSEKPSGIYFIKVQTNTGAQVIKVLKQ